MRALVSRSRKGVFYYHSSSIGPQKKLLRLLCCCSLLMTLYLSPRLLTFFSLQSGKRAVNSVIVKRDHLSLTHFLEKTARENASSSQSKMKFPDAENPVLFSPVGQGSEKSKLMVQNLDEFMEKSRLSKSSLLEHGNQSYMSVSFKIKNNKFEETLYDDVEAGSIENFLNKFLPLASVNELNEVDSSDLTITVRPSTWLQLIRLGMIQRDPEYLKKHIQVIPDAVAPTPARPNGNATSLKKILFWNKFYESPDFDFGSGHEPFITAGCPVNSCYVTSNRTLFRLEDVDAVIWHGRDDDRSLPPKRQVDTRPMLTISFRVGHFWVYPHTRYVFFMAESPEHVYLDLELYRNVFNYTMTFRTDSEIYNPYGFFTLLTYPELSLLNKNYAVGKTRMAAWLVQNLQKYIPVDVFGKCGTKSCPKHKDHNPDECFRLVEKKYKFYFAFENSLCDNYITEKFFGAARFDIVPVVYGLGAYEELAPSHSFINALDFASTRHLADYLKYLDSNDTAYNQYFDSRIIQRCITIGPWSTDWLSISPPAACNTITLIIPGNPGVVTYYEQFMVELYEKLHESSAVWAISHTCHTINYPTSNSTVNREVEHKVKFIRAHVPRGCRLRLIGHSIGCQMILKALDQLTGIDAGDQPADDFEISQCYMLFPTIERMRDSPRGQTLWPVLAYCRWLPPFMSSCLSILPNFIQEKFAGLFLFDGSGVPLLPSVVASFVTNIRPDIVRNMLDLAHDELETVVNLDVEAVSRHKSKLVFYYGTSDLWCPLQYKEELVKRVPGVVVYVCQRNISHAFVVRMAKEMAVELTSVIQEVEELHNIPDTV
ncbi:Lipid droplet-associated hydrolase [Trinorchestia longiramus]|nr:Lipid droplet-associated hydrolase [Trinorchestia longiramus]